MAVIGIDSSRANEEQKTGVGWYIFFLIEELKQLPLPNGITIRLYSREPLQGSLALLPKGFESRVLSWPPRRLWTQVRLSLEMLLHPVDTLFVPAHVLPLWCPQRTCMTVHDIAALRFPFAYSFFERWLTQWSAERALGRNSESLVFVPSAWTRDELVTHIPKEKIRARIHVTPLGCDPAYARRISDTRMSEVRRAYSLPQSFIVCVGRKEYKKNTQRVIEAFLGARQSLPQGVVLLLIGSEGYGYAEIEAYYRGCTEDERRAVRFIPYMSQEDVIACVQMARMSMLVSLYEGFGIPALESLAAGVPCLVSRGLAFEEIGQDAFVYAAPEDVQDIQHQIVRLYTDETLRIHCQTKGYERAKIFSWAQTARQTATHLFAPYV